MRFCVQKIHETMVSTTRSTDQAVDPLYFMSYVIHHRRRWVILVLGLRYLARPAGGARFEGFYRASGRSENECNAMSFLGEF